MKSAKCKYVVDISQSFHVVPNFRKRPIAPQPFHTYAMKRLQIVYKSTAFVQRLPWTMSYECGHLFFMNVWHLRACFLVKVAFLFEYQCFKAKGFKLRVLKIYKGNVLVLNQCVLKYYIFTIFSGINRRIMLGVAYPHLFWLFWTYFEGQNEINSVYSQTKRPQSAYTHCLVW